MSGEGERAVWSDFQKDYGTGGACAARAIGLLKIMVFVAWNMSRPAGVFLAIFGGVSAFLSWLSIK